MRWQDRITVDPDVLVGKPIIEGTRIFSGDLGKARMVGTVSFAQMRAS